MNRCFEVILLIFSISIPAAATIINVPEQYSTIQIGIDSSINGDTILVQPGIYYETINFNGHNVVLGSLYLTTQDTAYISQTIVDGDSSGTVITFTHGEDRNTKLIGFLIRHGCAHEGGGGIRCSSGSSPVISNNIIESNVTFCGYSQGGGGISCLGSSAYISNNIIRMNRCGEEGGGIYTQANAKIVNNIIENNHSDYEGGGIYCGYNDRSLFKGNTIIQNTANSMGGGISAAQCSTKFYQNIIYGNRASQGGAIYANQGAPSIINCSFSGNFGTYGGGISGLYSSPIIINCIFWGDTAQSYPELVILGGNQIVKYTDVQGGYDGEGNFNTNPFFRNPEGLNFHLMSVNCNDISNSTCIDAGDSSFLDSELSCEFGLGGFRSDLGAYGGGDTIPYSGRIFNVPSEYSTIQEAIAATFRGDTVLIQPGVYNESISLMGRQITLGSLFILTGDTAYISSTILQGLPRDTAVRFFNGEDSMSILEGITIQNSEIGITCTHGVSPIIKNNIIRNNNRNGQGGGIICSESDPKIVKNIIENNSAVSGGGIWCNEAMAIIQDNIFRSNIATADFSDGGGAILCEGSDPLICKNIFVENSAYVGGAISCSWSSNPRIVENIFRENRGTISAGGVYLIGSESLVANNIFIRNFAPNGAAIGIFDSTISIIINNISWEDSAYSGPAIYCVDSGPLISNCIFWGGHSNIGDEIRVFNFNNQLEPIITYCDIMGGWNGQGNINYDPLFRNPDEEDFRLSSISCGYLSDSPCIDAGDPSIADSLLDCNWGMGTNRADIGSYGGRGTLSSIYDNSEITPLQVGTLCNYPNPFNAQTTIRYGLPEAAVVTVDIYDIMGRKVETLQKENREAGSHLLIWNSHGMASGIYFYKIQAGKMTEIRKMVVIK
jgi:hypothetical protein